MGYLRVVELLIFLVLAVVRGNNGITVHVCEHRGIKQVKCPINELIYIKYAMYGRLQRRAGGCSLFDPPAKRCVAESSLNKTKAICNEKNSCSLLAANSIYGDPCVSVVKYLKVEYICLPKNRTNFETPPSLTDDKNLKLGQRLVIQGCRYFNNTGRSFNGSWIRDREIVYASAPSVKLKTSVYVFKEFVIEKTSLRDEGNYRCVLEENGEVVARSGEFQILFDDEISRVRYHVTTIQLQTLQARKKRSTGTDDDIISELRSLILRASPSSVVRFIGAIPRIEIVIATLKTSNETERLLYDQTRFLLDVENIGEHSITIENFEYCSAETIGSVSFKGQYSYPSSVQGTKVTKKCVHGSMNVELISFTRTCKKLSNGKLKWSSADLSHCLTETKTTQELIDLKNKPICTKKGQKDCQLVTTISNNLTSTVSSSAVISIPEDVALVTQIVSGIATNIQTVTSPNETKQVLGNVLDVTSSITEATPQVVSVAEKTDKSSESLRESLNKIGEHTLRILPPGSTLQASSKNIGFVASRIVNTDKIRIVSKLNPENKILASVEFQNQNGTKDFLAEMWIPDGVLVKQGVNDLLSYTYQNDALFKGIENKTTGSSIIAVIVSNRKIQNLQTPINITFKISDPSILQRNPNCSFWHETKDDWSTEGVTSSGIIDGSTYLCQTNHLTNFALIIDVSQQQANPLALQYITWVGCGISLAGLMLTIFSYSFFRRLRRKLVPKLLICLCFSLVCTILIFLVGVEETKSKTGCQVIAGLLHYFLLVTFSWMAVQGINLYRSLVQIFKSNISSSQFFIRSFITCTGVPAIVVIVTGSVRSKDYGGENLCVVTGISFFATLLVPIAFILIMNLILLVLVLRGIRKTQMKMKSNKRASGSNNEENENPKQLAKITIACSILLGLTWLFGVLAVGELTLVMQYLFCIFNSLQGFFIFIFYTLTNVDVRKEWKGAVGWETISSTFSQTRATQYSKSHTTKSERDAANQNNGDVSISNSGGDVRYSIPPPQMPYRSVNLNVSRGITNTAYVT